MNFRPKTKTRTTPHLLTLAAALAATFAAPQASADGFSGAYLAGRQAIYDRDFETAAGYYTQALAHDPSNAEIIEDVIMANVSLGRIETAAVVAAKLEADGHTSQVAQMALASVQARDGDFAALIKRIDDEKHMGELIDQLVRGWAALGAGDMSAALAAFDASIEGNGSRAFGLYHKALALAHVGDLEAAEAIFADPAPGSLVQTRRGVIAHVQVLSQMGRNDKALAVINDRFASSSDPEIRAMRQTLEGSGSLNFDIVGSPSEGVAEVYFTIAGALLSDAPSSDTLMFARVAQFLRPEHVDAALLVAQILEKMGQHEAASDAYRTVPQDSPAFHVAELGRADTLRAVGKDDAAIEVLEQLTKTHPDLPVVHTAHGDLMRLLERFDEAIASYDKALDLRAEAASGDWFIYYTRGIAYERLGDWEASEADFRRALEISPEQPNVLNYLGYSLVEKNRKLDEALEMIERAAAASPNSGYIIDSLGWAMFRLGRFDDAVPHMERAAELMSIDPVVNDHLGDVYWAVGRKLEAEFQWKRALSFVDQGDTSQEADPERIRRKLDVGLDAVLSEEGEEPLNVANDEG
ncbi:tetratricopeptide repeat protein [Lentibacter algarum]|uniref:tetratricopeptide repeat protein n=1 Tax=Lentibacter algarum TaxID=576131 RepID=UPI00339D9CDD